MSTALLSFYSLDQEEEKKLILREYRSLLSLLKDRLKKGDKKIMRRAFEIAADSHKHMRRKSGEPYILHPIAVAKIVVEEISLGLTSVICALLHDTVEDTELTLNDIEMEFGKTPAKIVEGLTKISNVVETNSTTQQAENFKKILLTLAEDPRVILIKIADRLHNMRTLESMRKDKQLKIASETSFIYAPLAHRLGLYEIKSELEDLALKYTQPEIFNDIVSKLEDTKRERNKYIKEFIKPLKDELENSGLTFDIFGRSKSIHSIWNKMTKKEVAFEEVFDLFAIRIILPSALEKEKEDCWKAYSIVSNLYNPNTERMRDWLSSPKSNGYEALHTTVMGPNGRWIEVQIRSQRMNEIAEKGLAAHWKYKDGNSADTKFDDWLKNIRDLLQEADGNAMDFVSDFKNDLFKDEIFCYSPKGDLHTLPKGATALDFAFSVHSELGKQCIGAKVNYKLVPISHQLQNGDQLEIITSKKQKPNEDWLAFVITAKAKSRIKYYLKEEKRIIAEEGKLIFARKMKTLQFENNQENIQTIVHYFHYDSSYDLYFNVATNHFDFAELKKFSNHAGKISPPENEIKQVKKINEVYKSTELNDDIKKLNAKDFELILFGEKSDKVLYKLANCCQPIPGDDVFGFVTTGEGLKIHRINCKNAPSLLAQYGHRVIKAKWAKNKEISFLSALKIIGLDDVGVIHKITNIISGELKINMRSMSIDSTDGIFEGNIKVFVRDKEELEKLCVRLKNLEGIQSVTRTDLI